MATEDKNQRHTERLLPLLIAAITAAAILFAYLEMDSWIQRSQLKDLQRRVGQLEQKCQ